MFCKNCKTELSEGSKFCPVCGTPVEAPAAAEPAEAFKATPESDTSEFTPIPSDTPVKPPKKKRDKIKLPLKPIIGIAAIVVIILAVLCILKSCEKTNPTDNSVLYIKKDEMYYYQADMKKPVKLTDDYDSSSINTSNIAVTTDGKVFYPGEYDDYGYTLCYMDPKKGKQIEIDNEVANYFISKDGKTVLYTKYDDDKTEIYTYNFKKSEKLVSDAKLTGASDDAKGIIYTSDGELYFKSGTKDEICIFDEDDYSSISHVYFDINADKCNVTYVIEDDLYYLESGKKEKKLAKKIDRFIAVYDGGKANYIEDDYLCWFDGKKEKRLSKKELSDDTDLFDSYSYAYSTRRYKVDGKDEYKTVIAFMTDDDKLYVAVEGKTTEIKNQKAEYIFLTSASDDESDIALVYCEDYDNDDDENDYVVVPISNGSVKSAKRFEDVDDMKMIDKDTYLIVNNYDDGLYDIYVNNKMIAEEADVEDGNGKYIIYVSNIDKDNDKGDIYLLDAKKKKATLIEEGANDDLNDIVINENGTVFVQKDDELTLIKNGKSKDIDDKLDSYSLSAPYHSNCQLVGY